MKLATICSVLVILCCSPACPLRAQEEAVAPSAAIETLRHIYANQDDSLLQKQAEEAAKLHPADAELLAWHAVVGPRSEAIQTLTTLQKNGDRSAWVDLVRATVGNGWEVRGYCNKAIGAAPQDNDLLLLAVSVVKKKLYTANSKEQSETFQHEVSAFLTEHQAALDTTAIGLAVHGELLSILDLYSHGDHTADIVALADRALTLNHDSVRALLLKSDLLTAKGDKEGAAKLFENATVANSDSMALHLAYWKSIPNAPDVANGPVFKDAQRFFSLVKLDDSMSMAILSELESFPILERAIGEQILKQHPDSSAADMATYMLAMVNDPRMTPDQNAPLQIAALEALIDRPTHRSDLTLRLANESLTYELPLVEPVDLDRLYKALLALDGNSPSAVGILAEHKQHLADLENIATKQLDAQWKILYTRMLDQTDKDGFVDFELSNFVAPWQGALGWVYFQEGKLDAAQQKLAASLALSPQSATDAVRLGRVYEAKGDPKQAEKQYISALALPVYTPGEHIAVQALRESYIRTHNGSQDGLAAYMAPILAKDLARRKEAVLHARITSPEPIPAFNLKTLDDKIMSSEDLKGKAVVINFWATWCGPCRKELPDLDKFYQKYKDDPRVVVLSMATDEAQTPVKTIEDFIAGHKYTFPVLLGPEYAVKNNIAPIPMTWFIDPQGKKAFQKIGYTKELEEEFGWRVEAIAEKK